MLAVLNALQRFPRCNEWSDGVRTDSLLTGKTVFCQHLHYIVSTITIFQSCCFCFISRIHPFNCYCVRIYHSVTMSRSLVLSHQIFFANPSTVVPQGEKEIIKSSVKFFLRNLKCASLKHNSLLQPTGVR